MISLAVVMFTLSVAGSAVALGERKAFTRTHLRHSLLAFAIMCVGAVVATLHPGEASQ